MPSNDYNGGMLERLKQLSELLRNGSRDEIDLPAVGKEIAEITEAYGPQMKGLDSACETVRQDAHDFPKAVDYLSHILKTTETGVTNVLNTAEQIMDDTSKVRTALDGIAERVKSEDLRNEIRTACAALDAAQDNCFNIITSLEFEDINRQLLEKVLERLDGVYGNLLDMMVLMRLDEPDGEEDSVFLKGLKRIFDISDPARHSQDVADELFEEF